MDSHNVMLPQRPEPSLPAAAGQAPYPAVAVANFFVQKGLQVDRPVDPMRLQKLVYFAHGWHLAIHGLPLINERVEAWPYGPVVPSIYHEVKRHGAGPIEFPILKWVGNKRVEVPQVDDGETTALLERIWEVYGGISSLDLSLMSHDPSGPWFKIWNEDAARGAIRGVDIPDADIESYFVRVAKTNRKILAS